MTLAEYLDLIPIMRAAGRTTMPVRLEDLESMATKSIGKVSTKALAKGKIAPVDKAPVTRKIAKKAKADRTEKALRKNREAKR